MTLEHINRLIEKNSYEEAEQNLIKMLKVSIDDRLYFELAKVQRRLNKFKVSTQVALVH